MLPLAVGILTQQENSKKKFEGFLASVFHEGQPIGMVRQTDDLNPPNPKTKVKPETKLACNNTSLTHIDDDDKSEIYFEWMAPEDLDPNTELELR